MIVYLKFIGKMKNTIKNYIKIILLQKRVYRLIIRNKILLLQTN